MFTKDDGRDFICAFLKIKKLDNGEWLCWCKQLNGIASIKAKRQNAVKAFCKDAEECYGDIYQILYVIPQAKPITVPSWDPKIVH